LVGFAAGFFASFESRGRTGGGSFKAPVVGRPANKSTGAGATSIVRPAVLVVVITTATGLFVVPVVRPPVATATGAGAIVSSFVGTFVPVRLCERVLMIEVLVRVMVERFESKGEIFLWNKGNKSKIQ